MVALPPENKGKPIVDQPNVKVFPLDEFPPELASDAQAVAKLAEHFIARAGDAMWQAILERFNAETSSNLPLDSDPSLKQLFLTGLKSGFFNAAMIITKNQQ